MRILVISDSHRKGGIVNKILELQPEAKDVFFLGDVVSDIEDLEYEYTDRRFYIVSGNCDFVTNRAAIDIAEISGKRILYTHGHTLGVKSGADRLLDYAKSRNCDIALYGHTHIPSADYRDGIYILNPGSCSQSRNGPNSYAVIDITPSGIMPIIIKM